MSLNEVWEAASANPFSPVIPKSSQFVVGFNLLLLGKALRGSWKCACLLTGCGLAFVLTGLFGLS